MGQTKIVSGDICHMIFSSKIGALFDGFRCGILMEMDGVCASESAPPPAAAPARHAPPPAAVSLADLSELIQVMANACMMSMLISMGTFWKGNIDSPSP